MYFFFALTDKGCLQTVHKFYSEAIGRVGEA